MNRFFVYLIFFCFLGLGIFSWRGIYLPKAPALVEPEIFSVEKGQGLKEISIGLEKEGLIKFSFLFRIYALTQGVAGKLQAGEYLLSPAMNIPEIAEKFVRGDIIKEKITIIEGWNLKDIEEELNSKFKNRARTGEGEDEGDEDKSSSSSFAYRSEGEVLIALQNLKVVEFQKEFDFLGDAPVEANLEGFLFPDTYEIFLDATPEDIIKKMLVNFDRKLKPDLREEIKRQGKTIFEIITLASLIEKEVKTLADKKIVSGILRKRLKNNMPLQVDATITYITGKKTTKISIEETKIDSPYNTYKYPGLPLGPISNPGLESILAALYPEDSEYLYYLSGPEGETVFSKTLEEHNLAKAKYLK